MNMYFYGITLIKLSALCNIITIHCFSSLIQQVAVTSRRLLQVVLYCNLQLNNDITYDIKTKQNEIVRNPTKKVER